jgi:cell division protein FtsN
VDAVLTVVMAMIAATVAPTADAPTVDQIPPTAVAATPLPSNVGATPAVDNRMPPPAAPPTDPSSSEAAVSFAAAGVTKGISAYSRDVARNSRAANWQEAQVGR